MVTRSAPATEGGSRSGRVPAATSGREGAPGRAAAVRDHVVRHGCAGPRYGRVHSRRTPWRPPGSSCTASTAASPQHRGGDSHGVQLVVEASGDLLIHSAVLERALVLGGGRHYDFAPMFTQIKPYIRGADLALCHVETPMTPAPPAGYPPSTPRPPWPPRSPRPSGGACSTAGTHALDQGQRGVDDTIRALDRAGVAHTGTFSSAAAQKTPLIMTVKGVRVAPSPVHAGVLT
jgi:hypothetical protein